MCSGMLRHVVQVIDRAAAVRPARRLLLPEVRWALAALVLFLAGLAADLSGGPAWLYWTLYLGCYVAGGWEPLLAGLRALRERTLDVDLLMVVAAVGAAAIGQVLDGGLLIVIFATSGALEAVATQRTADSVRSLLDLTGEADTYEVGDEFVVRPGERIGGDGVVVDGASEVDQSSITGESMPVPKAVGDEVFAGTLNGTGVLRVRVTRDSSDTVLARIVAMVEEASATKAKTQLFIEKIEQRYSVGVVVATLALFLVPLVFGAELQETLLRAMTFMIVASPCAVVLATMPPLLSAIANAGRHGVLVKSAVVLERLGATERVAFDKTGTLTEGSPRVVEVRPLGMSEKDVLRLAAGAEQASEHPLGWAIVAAADRVPRARDFRAEPGRGVHAVVDGRQVFVGRDDGEVVREVEADGRTAVLVRVDGEPAGVLGLADRVRPDARAAVTALIWASPVLLTGDNSRAAARVADEVGITDVRAGLLPQDKVAAVRELGERVLLVGDGVNDAPALAAADTGVAMGRAGSDLALETADAVVVRDELTAIPAVVALARRARRLVLANLAIAGVFIVGLVLWDLFGELPLPLGVAGHEGSTVLVALNGLRLLREKAWRG